MLFIIIMDVVLVSLKITLTMMRSHLRTIGMKKFLWSNTFAKSLSEKEGTQMQVTEMNMQVSFKTHDSLSSHFRAVSTCSCGISPSTLAKNR